MPLNQSHSTQQVNWHHYLNRRVLRVFGLGISSGLPWVILGTALTLWLKEAGFSRSDIGYAGALFAAYSVNFLWSPLVDRLKLPVLGKRFGQRRSWIIAMQLLMIAGCLLASQFSPEQSPKLLILSCLLVAIAASSQDIAIDAYRIDSFEQQDKAGISAAAAMATAGWWTGYAAIGFVPLWLSENAGWSWQSLYQLLACVIALLMLVPILSPEPQSHREQMQAQSYQHYLQQTQNLSVIFFIALYSLLLLPLTVALWAFAGSPGISQAITGESYYLPSLIILELLLISMTAYLLVLLEARNTAVSSANFNHHRAQKILAWLLVTLAQPIREFFSRNGLSFAVAILSFVFLFKIGEAFLGKMSIVFYKEIGFTNTQIGFYSKLGSWWVTIAFSLIGGWVNIRFGIVRGLLISGIAMAASNLMFAWIAIVGPDLTLYAATIVVDGFTAAWSTVAFVSFISFLCSHSFSATQYALMASLGTLGKTLLSSTSGQIVDWLDGDWATFFLLTAVMVTPSIVILLRMSSAINALHDTSEKLTDQENNQNRGSYNAHS